MKLTKIITAAFVTGAAFLVGCEKNEVGDYIPADRVTSSDASLKINYNSLYAANPSVYFRINGNKVSGAMTARSPFPGGGFNTGGDARADYLVLKPGEATIDVILPKKILVTEDSLKLFTTKVTTEAGKFHILHITDTAANTTSVFTTEDNSRPDSGYSKLRFINLMPNVPAVDLYYGTTIVATNIGYKSVSAYFNVPAVTGLAWAIRPAGAASTTTALATYTSATTTANRRVTTAFAIGYNTATDAVRKPYISFMLTN